MKKVIISMPAVLLQQIDEAVKKWGFLSRTEFLRMAAMDFLRTDHLALPADSTLKEHTQVVMSVKNRRGKQVF